MSDAYLLMFGCAVSFAALAGAYIFLRSQVVAVRRIRAVDRRLDEGRRLIRLDADAAMRAHSTTHEGRRDTTDASIPLYLVE